MGRSVVMINGKTYDAISGLPIEETVSVAAEPEIELTRIPDVAATDRTATTTKAGRRSLTKQERMAAAIKQEFNIGSATEKASSQPESAPTQNIEKTNEPQQSSETSKATPDWLRQFTEDHAKSSYVHRVEPAQSQIQRTATDQPAWIVNYVEGGAPIEIEPIGLEKVAKESQKSEKEIAARQTATSAGRTPQRSQTLNRSFVKKPAAEKTSFAAAARSSAPVATHPLVHKYDSFHIPVTNRSKDHMIAEFEEMATPQPILTRDAADRLNETTKTPFTETKEKTAADQTSSGRSLKEALIKEQLSTTDQKLSKREQKKLAKEARKQTGKRRFRASSLVTAGLAIAIIGGFFTYTQMPNLSVRVAANKAGIDAKNPYMPSGYSIDGPVAYSRGTVTINYKSNGGGEGYSFTQQRSDLDETAIVDKVVDDPGKSYETLMAADVVVYRYGNKAAWVEGGILYTVNGNSRISDNQILEIAGSV